VELVLWLPADQRTVGNKRRLDVNCVAVQVPVTQRHSSTNAKRCSDNTSVTVIVSSYFSMGWVEISIQTVSW